MTDKQVWEAASRLLANSKVAARLAELRSKAEQKSLIKVNEVIELLSSVVRADITDYVDPNGTIRVAEIRNMPIEQRRLIESVKATRDAVQITLVSKMAAIERLSKMLGWDAPEKKEHTHTVTEVELSLFTPAQLEALAALGKATLEE